MGGRPGRRGYVQCSATNRLCQRSSVFGLTMMNARQQRRGSTRLSAASRSRSRGVNCGLVTCRRRIVRAATREFRALRTLSAREQHHQLEQTARNDIQKRHGQEQPPRARERHANHELPVHASRTCPPRGRVYAPHGQARAGGSDADHSFRARRALRSINAAVRLSHSESISRAREPQQRSSQLRPRAPRLLPRRKQAG